MGRISSLFVNKLEEISLGSVFMRNIVVIGGGPAGMMAAGTAAQNGNKVTIVEKNERFGKKLFITGKGRCNVTNASDIENHFKNIINN